MNVGGYVRTKRGLIGKIVNINTFREPCMKYGIEASYLDDIWFIGDDDIKLVKEKPVDLIEVGDYVNGELVVAIHKDFVYDEISLGKALETANNYTATLNEDIKSIVTKEQFERIKYEVK